MAARLQYAQLTKLLEEHYDPKPSMIIQCYKFNTRSCQQGESVQPFVAELAEYCELGQQVDDMLRDGLWCPR